MICAGFNSDGLFILVGEVKPFNKFEIDDLLDRIQRELKLPIIQSETEAIEIIATAYVQRLISGDADSPSTLFALAQLYTNEGHVEATYDFYLLYYAAADLGMGETQYYWPDAHNGNIERIIRDRCLRWIEEHPLPAWRQFECETGG